MEWVKLFVYSSELHNHKMSHFYFQIHGEKCRQTAWIALAKGLELRPPPGHVTGPEMGF